MRQFALKAALPDMHIKLPTSNLNPERQCLLATTRICTLRVMSGIPSCGAPLCAVVQKLCGIPPGPQLSFGVPVLCSSCHHCLLPLRSVPPFR